MSKVRTIPAIVIVLALLPLLASACRAEDHRTLFERFGQGLAPLSKQGATSRWNMAVTQRGDTVRVLETFYSHADIWVGVEFDDVDLDDTGWHFSFDGKAIGTGGVGGTILSGDGKPSATYFVLSPGLYGDVDTIPGLPDEFTLQFGVQERGGWERVFEFEIPLKRSDREVVAPR